MRLSPPILILVIYVISQILFINLGACPMMQKNACAHAAQGTARPPRGQLKMETNHARPHA